MTDRVEGRPLEDVELARLARDGDVSAYGELVERYREVAFRTAWLITRSSAEAEDARTGGLREGLLRARPIPRRRGVPPVGPSDRVERGEEPAAVGGPARAAHRAARAGPRLGDAAPSPEAAALGREEREALLGALERLSEPERLVVTYRYLLELSEAETARALAIRPGP